MRSYVKPALSFLCICLGVGSCICGDLDRDSGLDPANDTRLDGTPAAGDSTLTVTLVNEYASEFRYRVDNGAWYETAGPVITVNYAAFELDEGPHTLTVVMVNGDGVEDDSPATVSFTVDMVRTTALLIEPRRSEPAPGAAFTVSVVLEELEEDYLNGADFTAGYDASLMAVDSVTYGAGLGNVTLARADIDSAAGSADVSFINDITAWDSVTGSGALVELHCRALGAGTGSITLSGAVLKTAAYPATDSVSARIPAVRGGSVVID